MTINLTSITNGSGSRKGKDFKTKRPLDLILTKHLVLFKLQVIGLHVKGKPHTDFLTKIKKTYYTVIKTEQ